MHLAGDEVCLPGRGDQEACPIGQQAWWTQSPKRMGCHWEKGQGWLVRKYQGPGHSNGKREHTPVRTPSLCLLSPVFIQSWVYGFVGFAFPGSIPSSADSCPLIFLVGSSVHRSQIQVWMKLTSPLTSGLLVTQPWQGKQYTLSGQYRDGCITQSADVQLLYFG